MLPGMPEIMVMTNASNSRAKPLLHPVIEVPGEIDLAGFLL
jgi:hypothetical protein